MAALAAGAAVELGGLTARELGGGRRAQLLAAVGTGTIPVLLGAGHLTDTSTYDILAWAALAPGGDPYRPARRLPLVAGRRADPRPGAGQRAQRRLFAMALVAGALLSGGRAMVLNRWFLAGTAIAVTFTVPDLWWQAQHHWAPIATTQALNQANGGLGNAGTWVIGQVIMVTLALVWVWLAAVVPARR